MERENATEQITKCIQEETTFKSARNTVDIKTPKGIFQVSEKKSLWIPDDAKRSYHEQRLSQSKWAFRLSFWGSILGFAVIVWCIWKSISINQVEWAGVISGTVIEAVSALFFYLSNKANEKITEFFKELTIDANVKDSMKLASEIKDNTIRDKLLVKLSLHLSGIDEERICKDTQEVCNKGDS